MIKLKFYDHGGRMANRQYEKLKYVMAYSKGQVSKAGRSLRMGATEKEREDAIRIVQDFRASHSYPLMLIKNHVWRTAKIIAPDVIIARRLKRLPTIINKLERPTLDGITANTTEITRMQDIGGCRAIFSSIEQVRAFYEKIKSSQSVHAILKATDYNASPKQSGYRGIHLIYNCYQNSSDTSAWKGHKIEVQVRTRVQHAWSTAVELIDLFERTDLKTGMVGHDDWRRLFQCLSTVLAALESDSYDATESFAKTLYELEHYTKELKFTQKLLNYTMAQDSLGNLNRKDGYYLITIHSTAQNYRVEIAWFKEREKEKAIARYNQMELDLGVYQTVLVGAQGAGSLVQAYPNFFADSTFILEILRQILGLQVDIPDRAIRVSSNPR